MIRMISRSRTRARTVARTAAASLAVLALAFSSSPGIAGDLQYPATNFPDRGARLGITLDKTPYTFHGISVIKVVDVSPASPLQGAVHPGDFIYGVNGFNLRSDEDVGAVVASGSVGSLSTVYFFDASRGYAAMQVTVPTISAAVAWSGAASASTPAATRPPSFCEEHYVICGFVAVAGAIGVANVLSGGSGTTVSSSGDDNSSIDRDRQEDERNRAQAEADRNSAAAAAQWESLQHPNSLGW